MTCAGWKYTWSRVLCGAACVATAAACSGQATVSADGLPPPTDAAPSDGQSGQSSQRDGSIAERYILIMPEVGQSREDAEGAKVPQDIATMRIDPADSVLVVERGQSATLSFRAFATMKAGGGEVEITARTVFYVPDNYLVGEFPADGSSLFTIRLPTSSADPSQRGGKVTIQA